MSLIAQTIGRNDDEPGLSRRRRIKLGEYWQEYLYGAGADLRRDQLWRERVFERGAATWRRREGFWVSTAASFIIPLRRGGVRYLS